MSSETATTATQSDREIILERILDAPRDLVWEAFTSVEHLKNWWGPTGFTTTTEKMNFRVGGCWKFMMHGPDGMDYPNEIQYDEIEKPDLLVFHHVEQEKHETACFGSRITFEDLGNERTRVVMRTTFPTKEAKDTVVKEYGAIEGGKQTLANLAMHLETLQGTRNNGGVLVIQRVLNAPQTLVWEAWTRAEHLLEWFHPESWHLSTCEMDLRAGGQLHYCMNAEGAPDMWGLWNIRTVRSPDLLEFVVSFSNKDREIVRAPFGEDWPLEVLTSVKIEPHAGLSGGTVMTMRSEPINANGKECAAFRAGISSMQMGWGQTLENLVRFLANR